MFVNVSIKASLAAVMLAGGIVGRTDTQAAGMAWEQLSSMPDRLGLGGPYAGVSDGQLIVAGGANFPQAMPWAGGKKRWYEAVYALPELRGQWKAVGKLIRPMAYGVSATTQGGVLCAGGSDLTRHYRDVFLLRLRDGKLDTKPLPRLPRPMANGCGALVGNTLYIAGGIEQPSVTNALRTFWSLDLSAKRPVWRELEPWPGPARMLAVAAAADGAFYLVSGTSLSGDAEGKPVRQYLTDVYRYRAEQGWKRVADIPRPAVAAPSPAPVVAGSQILVFSGDDGTKIDFQPMDKHPGFPRDILAYDPAKDTWRAVGTVRATQVTVPTALWRGRYVIPNGEIRPGVRTPEVWSFPTDITPADAR